MSTVAAPGLRLRQLWRRIGPLLLANLLYFGVLVYPVLRIRLSLWPEPPGTPELLIYMVGPAAARLLWEVTRNAATRFLAAAALTWLGVCFLALPLLLGHELLRVVVPLSDAAWGLLLTGSVAILAVAAFTNAQLLSVRRLSIPIADGHAPRLTGKRLVQITDVHLGSRRPGFLSRVVERVNELAPDWVMITGDLVDLSSMGAGLRSLEQLEAPAFFVIGNHERYVDTEAICAELESLGIIVLRNRSVEHSGLQIIGIDDAEPKSQVRRVLRSLSPTPDAFRILLYHRPDGAEDAARWGAHLMLCGHTHNGQLVPFNQVVKRIFPRICGHYRVSGLHLYVSPGTGTWGPVLRLGSRSEITLITLSPDMACNGETDVHAD